MKKTRTAARQARNFIYDLAFWGFTSCAMLGAGCIAWVLTEALAKAVTGL